MEFTHDHLVTNTYGEALLCVDGSYYIANKLRLDNGAFSHYSNFNPVVVATSLDEALEAWDKATN